MVGDHIKSKHYAIENIAIQLKNFKQKINHILFIKALYSELIKLLKGLIETIPSDYLPHLQDL